MPLPINTQDSSEPRRATRILFGFLLSLFDQHEPFEARWRLLTPSNEGDWFDQLPVLGEGLDLRMERVQLSPKEAADTSGIQTPLFAPLSDGGWLVLYGFRSGRVRAGLAHNEAVEERLLRPAEIARLLNVSTDRAIDWLVVQTRTSLENAVSHDHHEHLPPLRRLIELMRAERGDLWLLLGLAVGSGLLALASPVAVQALVNTVAMGGMGQPLVVLSIILFIFLAFSGAVFVLESYLVEIVQRRIFVRLSADLANRLPRVRCDVYDRHHGSELVNRFFDVLTVQKAGSSLLLDGVTTIMQAVVGLVLLAFYHPFLLAFDVVLLLAIGFIMFVLGQGSVTTAIAESKSKYALVAWLEIIARNLLTFKSDGGPQWAVERTDILAHAYLTAKSNHYRVLLRQTIGSVSLYAIASTALLAIGGYLVIEGRLTLGQLVAAELIVSSVLASLIKFGKHLEGFYDLMAGVDKIGHLLDLPLESERGVATVMTGPVSLAVRGLSFGYGAKRPVFAGLDFAVQAGERVALVGGQSSGKSTLADLLCGLRQPDNGQIEINDVDLGSLRLDALRRRIAVVGRVEIIEGSLFENVWLNRPELGPEQVKQALNAVGLLENVSGIQDVGLEIEVGPNGAPLSASQVRLLLLARAIAGEPALLILDGILDDMDDDMRLRATQALFVPDAPWTLLVLTRLPAVANLCDRVVELPRVEAHV